MTDYRRRQNCAQPVRDAFKRILLQCIANADTPDDQKELVMIACENRIIGIPETFALMQQYGLERE